MKKIDIQQIAKKCRQLDCAEIVKYLTMHGYKFWSWGVTGFTDIQGFALRFRTMGHHHKGNVYITLAANDTFTIYFTTLRGDIQDTMEDVYIDELFDRLDKRIEFIDDYKD